MTAAYVQDQMGLPGNPYESVKILQNKDRFRRFCRSMVLMCLGHLVSLLWGILC